MTDIRSTYLAAVAKISDESSTVERDQAGNIIATTQTERDA